MHTLSRAEVVKKLGSHSDQGLSEKEAAARLRQYGKNEFTEKKKKGFLIRFFEQFQDFMILVLIAAAVVSFFVSAMNGDADFTDPVIILAIVVLNAVLGVVQEEKAEKSLEALKRISAPAATVLRGGVREEIAAARLVPGDVIELEAGQYVPADARLLTAVSMKTDESSLTGESMPVKKDAEAVCAEGTLPADRNNMLYSTTIVTSGHGRAIVTATGMQTEVGRIADMILNDSAPDTPLQRRLAVIGKWLGIAALGICVVIFVMGTLQGRGLFDMFMTSVSLAVAAIPEALPGMVTIMLSLGVQRMAGKRAVVKKLPAVETLGSATWICSDKTGTLTENSMTVVQLSDASRLLEPREPGAMRILQASVLCCNVQRVKNDGQKGGGARKKAGIFRTGAAPGGTGMAAGSARQSGDPGTQAPAGNGMPWRDRSRAKTLLRPKAETGEQGGEWSGEATELALVRALQSAGGSAEKLWSAAERTGEIPFDSERKRMTTVCMRGQESFRITKGAPDILITRCTHYDRDGRIYPMTDEVREGIRRKNRQMTDRALRVLAVSYQPDLSGRPEEGLVFLGLIGMIDPPRKEAAACVRTCREAGITPVMITGDHVATACAIAAEIGILEDRKEAVTGAELDRMTQEELDRNIRSYRVFARVSPEHKVRIVRALQRSGEIVAMTGDGVNDAPALKAADIGCAMGKNGTDVAKNAADMVLMDDNFATIVEAVREGRGIYDNIRKSIHFLLSSNIGEIITIFTAILCRLPSPLAAVQLLWVNLVTDSLPAIALGVEPPEPGIMKRRPVPPEKGLFSGGLTGRIVLEGCMIGLLAVAAYLLGGSSYCFAVLSFSQLFHAWNMRSERSLFEVGFFSNCKMTVAFLVCGFLQAIVLTAAPFSAVFQVTPLKLFDWLIVLGLSIIPIFACELQKRLCRKRIFRKA